MNTEKIHHARWKLNAAERQARWFIGYTQRQMDRIAKAVNQ